MCMVCESEGVKSAIVSFLADSGEWPSAGIGLCACRMTVKGLMVLCYLQGDLGEQSSAEELNSVR